MRITLGLLSLFLSGFLIASPALANSKSSETAPAAKGVAAIENNFQTIGALIEGLSQMHLVNLEEKKTCIEFLAKNKIPASTKLVHADVNGGENKISWGRVSLAIEKQNMFKTQSGVYFHFDKSSTFDGAFADAFRALSGARATGVIDLVLPSARANIGDMDPVISASVYAATYHVVKTLMTAFYGVAGGALSLTGYPVEYMAVELWSRIYRNTVTCDANHDYVVHMGFEHTEWLNAYKAWQQSHADLAQSTEGFSTSIKGYSADAYALFKAGRDLYISSISPKEAASSDYVSRADVLEVWPDGVVPECSPSNADKVEAKRRVRSEKIAANFAALVQSSTTAKPVAPTGGVR